MSEIDRETFGEFLFNTIFNLGAEYLNALFGQPRLNPARNPSALVDPTELSVAMIDELPAGHLAPMPDQQHLASYHTSVAKVCGECGYGYYTGPANTHLITYLLEPQYTHRQHTCPGGHGGNDRLVNLGELRFYLRAGCRVIVRDVRAEEGITNMIRNPDGSSLRLDQATDEQIEVHTLGVNSALRDVFDNLPDLDEPDPILERARRPSN